MWPYITSGVVGTFLATTPFMWEHGTALAVVTVLSGAMAVAGGGIGVAVPGLRPALVVAGTLLVASTFALAPSIATAAIHCAAGLTFLGVGVGLRVRTSTAGAAAGPAESPSQADGPTATPAPVPLVAHGESRAAA